jgi:hypothetical protein
MWVIASSPLWDLGNGIHNMFVTIIAIVGGTRMIANVNWKNKLVCCVTNVNQSYYNGCCLTTSNNGFLTILILSDAALLWSCEIDSLPILISNKCVCRYLARVRNPCVGCKDCSPILAGFCSGTRVSSQDWVSPSYHFDASTSLVSSSVVDVVDCTSASLVIDCTPQPLFV